MTTTTFPKIDTRESFFKLFFQRKSWHCYDKSSNIRHPISATTTFPLYLSVEWHHAWVAGIEREKEMGQGTHAYSREAFFALSRSWHAGYDGPKGAAQWNGLWGDALSQRGIAFQAGGT